MQPLDLRAGDTLQQTLRIMGNQDFGGTDCSQPMVYALEEGLKVWDSQSVLPADL
jgi:hypothetical protein